jgi:hypothetical protein
MLLDADVGEAGDIARARETSHDFGRFVRSMVGLDRTANLPDGQITKIPSSPSRKNILLFRNAKSAIYPFPSRPETGAYRDRHERGVGCDGRGLRQARSMIADEWCCPRTEKSCGPDTLTPVSSWRRQTAGDGGKRARLTGESTKETVKTIACGTPGDPGVFVVTTLVCFHIFAYEAAGALRTRRSVRPHFFGRRWCEACPGRNAAAGMRGCVSSSPTASSLRKQGPIATGHHC